MVVFIILKTVFIEILYSYMLNQCISILSNDRKLLGCYCQISKDFLTSLKGYNYPGRILALVRLSWVYITVSKKFIF